MTWLLLLWLFNFCAFGYEPESVMYAASIEQATAIGFFDQLVDKITYGPADEAADAFNKNQEWFNKLDKTEENVDFVIIVRVRLFGSSEAKKRAWINEGWAGMTGVREPTAGVCISSAIPEVWLDCKKMKNGDLVPAYHVLGHEIGHVLKLKNPAIIDPDMITRQKTYR